MRGGQGRAGNAVVKIMNIDGREQHPRDYTPLAG